MHPPPTFFSPEIRRLWTTDQAALMKHFHRLDPTTRRMRFGAAVTEGYVQDYAERALSGAAVIFGAFADGGLRGVAELRSLPNSWPRSAEIALLVEPAWQDEGIGDALLGRIIAAARNRGVGTLHMLCLRENTRMQTLARKHSAQLRYDIGDVEATLEPPWPTPISMFEEVFGDTRGYLSAIWHLGDWPGRTP